MRRILVEAARSKGREKRGGDWRRIDFEVTGPTQHIVHNTLRGLQRLPMRFRQGS